MRASIRIKIRRSRLGDRPVVVGLQRKVGAHQNRALDIDRRRGGAVRGLGVDHAAVQSLRERACDLYIGAQGAPHASRWPSGHGDVVASWKRF